MMERDSACVAPIRLVASDLDGTLLRPDGSVSEYTRQVLGRLQAAGVVIALVSARPPVTLLPIAASAGVRGLAICDNGAVTYDLAREQVTDLRPLPAAVSQRLIETLRQAAPGVCFAARIALELHYEPAYEALSLYGMNPADHRADASCWPGQSMTKLLVRHAELPIDRLLSLVQQLGSADIEATHSGARNVEVSACGVNKASALAELCAALGIAPEQVVAFGDMPNDLAMLTWAGRGIAVANAHPLVLAAADEQTLPNWEDGVAVALERLLSPLEGLP